MPVYTGNKQCFHCGCETIGHLSAESLNIVADEETLLLLHNASLKSNCHKTLIIMAQRIPINQNLFLYN